MGDEWSEKAEHGGVWTCHFAGCVSNCPWGRCGRGGLDFLALVHSAARQLGGSAACRAVSSPAQWQRPRKWICARAPHRATKPSGGSDAQAELRRIPQFPPKEVSLKKVIPEKPNLRRGCPTPNPAGGGFGLGSGSHVWFLPKLGRRGIKLRRHQGPTGGGVGGWRRVRLFF